MYFGSKDFMIETAEYHLIRIDYSADAQHLRSISSLVDQHRTKTEIKQLSKKHCFHAT